MNFNYNFVHFSPKTYTSVSLECISSLQATTANQYKLGGLKQRMFSLLHFFVGQKLQIRGLQSLPPEVLGEMPFLASPASVDLCLHLAVSSVSLFCLCLIRTLVIEFGVHLDNPRSHFEILKLFPYAKNLFSKKVYENTHRFQEDKSFGGHSTSTVSQPQHY